VTVVRVEEAQRSWLVVSGSASYRATIASTSNHRQVQPRMGVAGGFSEIRVIVVNEDTGPDFLAAEYPPQGGARVPVCFSVRVALGHGR